MDKQVLKNEIIGLLEFSYLSAVAAAKRAHDTATNSESVAENKYDTFGLEASYLAHGQSVRVGECEADLSQFQALVITPFTVEGPIAIGSLIKLADENDEQQWLLLGPCAGGLKVVVEQQTIVVVTPGSPLGNALVGKLAGDEFDISIGARRKTFEVLAVS